MAADKITAETEVSTAELACVLGVTGRYIRQLAEDGVLEKVRQGRFLLCDSVQKYNAYTGKENLNEEDEKLEKVRRASEATLKASKAKIAKLEAAELEGKMHRSEDVEAMTTDLIYAIRGALLALPGRLAVDVAAVDNAAEAAALIRSEVFKVMKELSQYKYDPAKYEERVRDRRDWDTFAVDDGEDE